MLFIISLIANNALQKLGILYRLVNVTVLTV